MSELDEKSKKVMELLRERSGSVDTQDPVVVFLYHLCRDHLCLGEVERLVQKSVLPEAYTNFQLTNGWLGEYAIDAAHRLRESAWPRMEVDEEAATYRGPG